MVPPPPLAPPVVGIGRWYNLEVVPQKLSLGRKLVSMFIAVFTDESMI